MQRVGAKTRRRMGCEGCCDRLVTLPDAPGRAGSQRPERPESGRRPFRRIWNPQGARAGDRKSNSPRRKRASEPSGLVQQGLLAGSAAKQPSGLGVAALVIGVERVSKKLCEEPSLIASDVATEADKKEAEKEHPWRNEKEWPRALVLLR